jgi:hypothetical protein
MAQADRLRALAALSAGACVLAGTVAVLVAMLAGPSSDRTGYVSEAGVATGRYATTYRFGVHAGSAVAAVASSVVAMLAVALLGAGGRALSRLSGVGVGVGVGVGAALPLSVAVAVGLAMLTLGRGVVLGVIERTLLGLIALWLLAGALTVGFHGDGLPATRPSERTSR